MNYYKNVHHFVRYTIRCRRITLRHRLVWPTDNKILTFKRIFVTNYFLGSMVLYAVVYVTTPVFLCSIVTPCF